MLRKTQDEKSTRNIKRIYRIYRREIYSMSKTSFHRGEQSRIVQ